MDEEWNQLKVHKYIKDQIQENLNLEYKRAKALSRSDRDKREITKDVSAMANADGGIIFYGIKEYDEKEKRHLPEDFDPIQCDEFSREWLEEIINNIRPKIEGLVIYPVQLNDSPTDTIYVVDIPQSTTAHQATDHIYYKRYNFEVLPMEDYEVRDTMGRLKYPKFDVSLLIKYQERKEKNLINQKDELKINCELKFSVKNIGAVFAQYVTGIIQLPAYMLPEEIRLSEQIQELKSKDENTDFQMIEVQRTNQVHDLLVSNNTIYGQENEYGPYRYEPILPGLSFDWDISLRKDLPQITPDIECIYWKIYADNARPQLGKILVRDIKVRKKIPW